ncbi:DUF4013 domain-containing protein [Methanobrevibacter sp. TMH8]|uniref:DUF4013 domain-containing protein n=1 Tax=Methanobrevibacter sp. TMH8 TaxID=2848611 RepID=UPI001CC9878A|nr:DUF4013 domain-containing protein [Methanobrevibacter sp. TMH8]MBZ9570281.1 DUF4013 domain-containing protein [Methanobrevibacter sp. TMH8]
MDIVGLFKDSLIYPTKEWDKLLIFGVLIIIMSFIAILQLFGIALSDYLGAAIVAAISFILLFIISLILWGYTLSITRKSINNVDGDVPAFDWVKNFVDGLKVLVLRFIYYIIPALVTLIVAYATGAFNYIYQLALYYVMYGPNAIPQALSSAAAFSFLMVFVIGGIFFLVFSLLFLAAVAVLAETESLGKAVNIIDVFHKIGEIGWANYIIWVVLYAIILFVVINTVIGVVSIIPYIGIIIVMLILRPYADMFAARALGLVYNESKE